MSMNQDYRQQSSLVVIERDHAERLLDEALIGTFPASDPVAICIEGPPPIDTTSSHNVATEDAKQTALETYDH